jgi:hypothetical protein
LINSKIVDFKGSITSEMLRQFAIARVKNR